MILLKSLNGVGKTLGGECSWWGKNGVACNPATIENERTKIALNDENKK
jgi:hypothetical protein